MWIPATHFKLPDQRLKLYVLGGRCYLLLLLQRQADCEHLTKDNKNVQIS